MKLINVQLAVMEVLEASGFANVFGAGSLHA